MKLKEPQELRDNKKKFTVEQFKVELNQCFKKLDLHNECKAKAFVIIKGQCTLTMKNKIESTKECDEIEEKDDVIHTCSRAWRSWCLKLWNFGNPHERWAGLFWQLISCQNSSRRHLCSGAFFGVSCMT